ncbi:hypothetical protein [Haloferula sargassicola]
MKPLDSPALQAVLMAELDAGAKIVEGTSSPNWGKMKRLIILDAPFRTSAWKEHGGLTFRDINDPHYWRAEVEDTATHELLACRF